MEKGQGEVTQKIRASIKKKLAEICDFVDDELPEYIMILVANQRSKSQIEKDLSLFLRNDTENFTNWLWDLLNSLNACAKNSQTSGSKTEIVAVEKDIEGDEDALILKFDPNEHETDFLNEDTNDSILSKSVRSSSIPVNEVKEPPVSKQTHKISVKVKTDSATKSAVKFDSNLVSKGDSKLVVKNELRSTVKADMKSAVKADLKPTVKVRKSVLSQKSKELLSSAIIPVNKISGTLDEYDPTKPEYKKPSHSSSLRKYNGPAALQANKLLLKAVDDAAKSILDRKNLEDFYRPTPIKVLSSKQLSSTPHSNMQKNKPVHEVLPQLEFNQNISAISDASEFNVYDYPSDVVMAEVDADYEPSENRTRTIVLNSVPSLSDTSEPESSEDIEKIDYPYEIATVEECPKPTNFFVTLDGINRISFKRKYEEDSLDGTEEENTDKEEEEPAADEVVSSPEKKVKLNERCKYWPACKNSDQCLYHHPTVACKCFPDCKFGDKCLYIHPNCKFDALCSRKDCPFTHASKRKLPFISVPVKMVPTKPLRKNIVCKFYPKCTARNCPFIHPKLCRYGTGCRLPTCLFGHFPVPSRSQMKWQAV